MVDTNDEWITTNRLKKEESLDEDKGTSYLAAAQDLLNQMLIH
jgi:hypothetical protein